MGDFMESNGNCSGNLFLGVAGIAIIGMRRFFHWTVCMCFYTPAVFTAVFSAVFGAVFTAVFTAVFVGVFGAVFNPLL